MSLSLQIVLPFANLNLNTMLCFPRLVSTITPEVCHFFLFFVIFILLFFPLIYYLYYILSVGFFFFASYGYHLVSFLFSLIIIGFIFFYLNRQHWPWNCLRKILQSRNFNHHRCWWLWHCELTFFVGRKH